LKLAILQYYPKFGCVQANLDRISEMVDPVEADLFILPELFATGYIFEDREELVKFAEPLTGGLTYESLSALSRKKNAAFIGGFPERDSDRIFNSAMFVPPEGKPISYRKIHLFDREKLYFEPGDKPFQVIEFRGAKLGILICFDWIFPESYRTLALKEADLICHISNLVLPFCQKASYAHAVSNRVFIAVSNRTGSEENAGLRLNFTGQSICYSPGGEVLTEFSENEESVHVISIDIKAARAKFVTERNHVFRDRRPLFYEL